MPAFDPDARPSNRLQNDIPNMAYQDLERWFRHQMTVLNLPLVKLPYGGQKLVTLLEELAVEIGKRTLHFLDRDKRLEKIRYLHRLALEPPAKKAKPTAQTTGGRGAFCGEIKGGV